MTSRRWYVAGQHRLHARTEDPPAPTARPAAVLVHGLGVSSRYMVPTARALSSHRRVWAVDLPGFGRSTKPPRALTLAALADALDSWLRAARIGDPLLLANSFGCQVVVEFARRGAALSGLVLVGPTTDAAARTWMGQAARWLRNGVREPPSLGGVLVRDYLDCGLRRPAATFRYALEDPVEDHIAEVDAPILIVRGERDPIAPRDWCELLRDRAPRADLIEIPQAAHTVNYSHPAELAEVVEHHFSSR